MKQDTYKEVITIKHENAVVRVHIPDIAPEEKERRMRELINAITELMK